ncbi:putative Rho GTPase-activating protein [Forsythia ovata]|uniref:Rho GTPase-activating protein n=1 Tax=Forsythia ovata TaxID=205694 RepID=A0ABD1XBU6_9LAMI
MPSAVSPQWQEKASDFFQSSGVKLKEAGESAGTFVGEVAKDAKGNVADVAGKVGSVVKSRWALLQQPSTRHAVQERLISAAASTSILLRKGFSETKDKVVVGKTKVEEVAKKTAQKSKTLLTDIERWQKGVASTDVFGVPIEITVQRQESTRPVPFILVKCADYLVLSGLNSQELFKAQGDKKVIQQLVSLYNQEPNASLPEGVNPVDVAALMKCYIASLPEPLTTFELYNEIRNARSSIHLMRNILKRLPTVNYMTMELVTALLLRTSQKSLLNKMDAQSLAMEMAPVIMWQKGQRPELYKQFWSRPSKLDSKTNVDCASNYSTWDMLAEEGENTDRSSSIPLDDELPVDLENHRRGTTPATYHCRCSVLIRTSLASVAVFYRRFIPSLRARAVSVAHLAPCLFRSHSSCTRLKNDSRIRVQELSDQNNESTQGGKKAAVKHGDRGERGAYEHTTTTMVVAGVVLRRWISMAHIED